MKALDNPDSPQGSLPLCPVEDIFLCKLIQKDSVEGSSIEEIINYVEEALALRQSSTFELLKLLQDTIDAQRERIDSVSQVLHGDVSSEDLIIQMSKIDDMMKEDADNLCEVIDALNVKQKEYAVGIQNYISGNLQNQADIKRLAVELSSRRKLEEDLAEMNRQIAELSSETGEEAVRKVEDELMVCKNMIKCTVCYDRLKEVVIVKCCHMFCSQCIQRNIELRHRKCHACGTAFGQSDVRSVKI
ncbi:putative aminoacyltransferase, E1 ubiquitin-activating enzyme [Lupinus albus]|uniref:E3 ubiquitin protein ligase n=1 Tax=Lupinus albus TaxID=3870 RepID=A0A6A4QMQ1_LUPAL|nr:putative aminoacyltransferase, E1 ubiquitin-activating enzyme [Lupinus albus]